MRVIRPQAFTGFTGAITGMSSAGLAMSEIGVTYPDESFGKIGCRVCFVWVC